jgi:hypothetical protein
MQIPIYQALLSFCLAGSCHFGVNEAGTCGKSGTPLTQCCSRRVRRGVAMKAPLERERAALAGSPDRQTRI